MSNYAIRSCSYPNGGPRYAALSFGVTAIHRMAALVHVDICGARRLYQISVFGGNRGKSYERLQSGTGG